MNRLNALLLMGVFALLWQGPAGAQNNIPYDVMGSGGGQSTDGVRYLQDTVGQSVIGIVTNAANTHKIGYWYCVDALHIGPTSAVLITAFSASATKGGVELRWTIGTSDRLEGFNIYRSNDRAGSFERLNASVLPPDEDFLFRDTRVRPKTTYWYRLGAVDADGEFFSQLISAETPEGKTALRQNYPNPFNPQTTISFYLAETAKVSLTIYDAQGKRVRRLADGVRNFGNYEIVWDGQNDRGEMVSSGIYFYRLVAGKTIETKKLTLLK